jgi:circadian clock protein KaiC
MERIDSGNPGLDAILGGGYVANSTNLIMGMPGTGKTVLAQSILFHAATPERPALFLSTVSEPLDRMLRYVQQFEFFDPDKVGGSLLYEDLSETLRSRDLAASVHHIVDLIKELRPALLVIDSFKALHSFSSSPQEFRTVLSVLTAVLSSLAITSFWVGEYGADEVAVLPEFAVADSVVELVLKKTGTGDVRYLRVTKLRGSTYAGGEHAFRIGAGGLRLFPRLVTPEEPVSYELAALRSSTGVEALDEMLSDGLWKGSSTIVFGPPGSGKTLLGLHFVFRGIERGEKGLIATMQENPTQLQRIVHGFGWDLQEAIDSGMLTLLYRSPVGAYIDEIVAQVSETAVRGGVQRVLIDSVTDLAASSDEDRFRDFMYSLTQLLAVNGISALLTHETNDLFSTTVYSRYGISHMSDNVVLLSYVRRRAEIARAIAVIKTRASDHDSHTREFVITPRGITVGETFDWPAQDGGTKAGTRRKAGQA